MVAYMYILVTRYQTSCYENIEQENLVVISPTCMQIQKKKKTIEVLKSGKLS